MLMLGVDGLGPINVDRHVDMLVPQRGVALRVVIHPWIQHTSNLIVSRCIAVSLYRDVSRKRYINPLTTRVRKYTARI